MCASRSSLNTAKQRDTLSHVDWLSSVDNSEKGPLEVNNRIYGYRHTESPLYFLSNLRVVFRIFSECSENGTMYPPRDATSPIL